MFRPNKVATLFIAFALAGCASTPDLMSEDSGVSVNAGNTTFIQVPSGHGSPRVMAFTAPGHAVCPKCSAIAADYFKTGKLDQTVCDVCGAKISVGRGQAVAQNQ